MLETNVTENTKKIENKKSSDSINEKHYPSEDDFKSIGEYYSDSKVRDKALDILQQKLDKIEELKDLRDNPSSEKPKFSDQNFTELTKLEKQEPRVGKAIKFLKGFNKKGEKTIGKAWDIVKEPDDNNKLPEMVDVVEAMKKAINTLKNDGNLKEANAEHINEVTSGKSDTAVESNQEIDIIEEEKSIEKEKSIEEEYKGLVIKVDSEIKAQNLVDEMKNSLEMEEALENLNITDSDDKNPEPFRNWIRKPRELYDASIAKRSKELGITDINKASEDLIKQLKKEVITDVQEGIGDYAQKQGIGKPEVSEGRKMAREYLKDLIENDFSDTSRKQLLDQLKLMEANNAKRDKANTKLALYIAAATLVAAVLYTTLDSLYAGSSKK